MNNSYSYCYLLSAQLVKFSTNLVRRYRLQWSLVGFSSSQSLPCTNKSCWAAHGLHLHNLHKLAQCSCSSRCIMCWRLSMDGSDWNDVNFSYFSLTYPSVTTNFGTTSSNVPTNFQLQQLEGTIVITEKPFKRWGVKWSCKKFQRNSRVSYRDTMFCQAYNLLLNCCWTCVLWAFDRGLVRHVPQEFLHRLSSSFSNKIIVESLNKCWVSSTTVVEDIQLWLNHHCSKRLWGLEGLSLLTPGD